MSPSKQGLLGLPLQGTDLIGAIGLHAVVLFCVLGLQPQLKSNPQGTVLMAQWISAQAPAENAAQHAPVVETQRQTRPTAEPVKAVPRKPAPASLANTVEAPPEEQVLTTSRSELADTKFDNKPATESVNNSLPSRDESQSIPAYTPPIDRAGKADTPSVGGKPAPVASMNPDYLAELFRKLARHKVYPSELKKNKIEGRVVLKFTLAADGRVINSSIQQSSGSDSLDAAALQMLNKASPLPAIPSWMNRSEMTLAMPVEYSLLTDR